MKLLGRVFEKVEVREAVPVDPGDVLCYFVDLGVVLGAGERDGVLLDGDYVRPARGEGEGYGVSAGAGEEVYYDGFGRGRFGC